MRQIPILCVLGLAACGGGGGGNGGGGAGGELQFFEGNPKVQSIASTGFATARTSIAATNAGTTFTKSTVLVNVDETRDPILGLSSHEVKLTRTADINTIILELDGTSHTLTSTDGIFYTKSGGSKSLFLATMEVSDNVNASAIGVGDGPSIETALSGLAGFYLYGFNTDPAVVEARNDTASYSGAAGLVLATDLGLVVEGRGSIELDANFATSTIDGEINVTIRDGADVVPLFIDINEGAITGNTFTSTMTIDPTQLEADVIDEAAIEGGFFGPAAAEVAGTFYATGSGTTDGATESGLIAGGFSAAQN